LNKYIEVKNGKFVFRDFNKFIDSLSKDDPRREMLLRLKNKGGQKLLEDLLTK